MWAREIRRSGDFREYQGIRRLAEREISRSRGFRNVHGIMRLGNPEISRLNYFSHYQGIRRLGVLKKTMRSGEVPDEGPARRCWPGAGHDARDLWGAEGLHTHVLPEVI